MPKFLEVESNREFYNQAPHERVLLYTIQFLCPACKMRHSVDQSWSFNKDFDAPTVAPSVLVTWTDGKNEIRRICHSYINKGMIEFLGDCTHSLKGQIAELPEITIDDFFIRN